MSETTTPARIVLRAPNWLGDAVMAIPAMAAVRRAFPHAHLSVAGPAGVAALFREITDVRPDGVIELASRRGAARDALAAGTFDTCVLFPNSFRSAWEARGAGIAARWGFRTAGRGWLLARAVAKPPRANILHQTDYYRALVRGLDVRVDDRAPSLAPSPASLAAADALLGRHRLSPDSPFIAVMPGAAYGQAKQWPADRVASVVAKLVGARDVRCVILGAAGDRPAARAIESRLRAQYPEGMARVVDLVGETSLGALVGVLSRARLCVSNDSGGMHVAAALGRPVVAIFGPTDERVTRPIGDHTVITESVFCRPCMLRDCPIDHRCMKRITVDRVFDAVTTRLNRTGESS